MVNEGNLRLFRPTVPMLPEDSDDIPFDAYALATVSDDVQKTVCVANETGESSDE